MKRYLMPCYCEILMHQLLNKIFIGTMSGTSYDGIDVCAMSVDPEIKLLHFASYKYPKNLRKEIAKVIEHQTLSLQKYGELDHQIGMAFASAVNNFILQRKIARSQICAVGLSGQTLWHHPQGNYPFSIQAGDAQVISKRCKIDVVSDFRNDHIKLGGEGAPLVPEFHQQIFASAKQSRLILNIGGIANYSFLEKSKGFMGSDTGPGNALLDAYCQKYLDRPFDKNGLLARKGLMHLSSLNKMLTHPFFKQRSPKSTGKEVFNLSFIPQALLKQPHENILATLTELSAMTIGRSIQLKEKLVKEIVVCGGGINNLFLLERISHYASTPLQSSEIFGFQPQSIEAMAFAWLASQRVKQLPLTVKKKKGLVGKVNKFKL